MEMERRRGEVGGVMAPWRQSIDQLVVADLVNSHGGFTYKQYHQFTASHPPEKFM